MEFFFLITGGIFGIIFMIVLIVNMTIYFNNQSLIKAIDKNLVLCYNEKQFNQLRNGQLLYYTGAYYGDKAFDEYFNMKFNETIRIRQVEDEGRRS